MGKINSMSLVSFLDHQQKCRCTLLSIPLEKKHFPANTEIGWKLKKYKSWVHIATSRTVSHLSLWMHIAVNRSEKKRVRENKEKNWKTRKVILKERGGGWQQTNKTLFFFSPLPSPPSVTFHIVTFNLQWRVKGLRHIGRIQMFDSSLNKPEQKCFYATRSSQPQPI